MTWPWSKVGAFFHFSMNFVENRGMTGGDGRVLITLWVFSLKAWFYTRFFFFFLGQTCGNTAVLGPAIKPVPQLQQHPILNPLLHKGTSRFYAFKKTRYLKKTYVISLLPKTLESTTEWMQSKLKWVYKFLFVLFYFILFFVFCLFRATPRLGVKLEL